MDDDTFPSSTLPVDSEAEAFLRYLDYFRARIIAKAAYPGTRWCSSGSDGPTAADLRPSLGDSSQCAVEERSAGAPRLRTCVPMDDVQPTGHL